MGELPYWPVMLKRATAAKYCDLSVAEFEREVAAGLIPMPIKLGNSEHWNRYAIDEAFNRMSGTGKTDWRASSSLYNAA